jgi:branched-subunit amino acid aminotransferase/4-amino-4-deoxychorismate lyase
VTESHVFCWQEAEGLVPGEPPDRPLLVADSWLVDEGAVRALERHYRRFAGACAKAAGLRPAVLDRFWSAVCAALPRTGQWFPRVELVGGKRRPELSLRVRPAPVRAATASLWVYDGRDPRQFPARKGPDIPVLAELRRRACEARAQDALLTADGIVLEAAHASVVWWEAGTLCVPEAGLPLLPGVTVGLVREHASALGVRVRGVKRRPADLYRCEVWLLNALHGIREVIAINGRAVRPAARIREWRNWLDSLAIPAVYPEVARAHHP